MKEDLAISKNNILQLQQENSELRNEIDTLSHTTTKQLKVSTILLIFVWTALKGSDHNFTFFFLQIKLVKIAQIPLPTLLS